MHRLFRKIFHKIHFTFCVTDDDYLDQIDLFICCIILQRQIDCIGGKKENITVPSVTMKKLREQEQAGMQNENH